MIVKCPSCNVEFNVEDPNKKFVVCPICDSRFSVDSMSQSTPKKEKISKDEIDFSKPTLDKDSVYSKTYKDLKFAEEVIWPTAPRKKTGTTRKRTPTSRPKTKPRSSSVDFIEPEPVSPPIEERVKKDTVFDISEMEKHEKPFLHESVEKHEDEPSSLSLDKGIFDIEFSEKTLQEKKSPTFESIDISDDQAPSDLRNEIFGGLKEHDLVADEIKTESGAPIGEEIEIDSFFKTADQKEDKVESSSEAELEKERSEIFKSTEFSKSGFEGEKEETETFFIQSQFDDSIVEGEKKEDSIESDLGLDLDLPHASGTPLEEPGIPSAGTAQKPQPSRVPPARKREEAGGKEMSPVAKVFILFVILIVGIGIVMGQTDYGYFGINLFKKNKKTQKVKPKKTYDYLKGLEKFDTISAYKKRVRQLELKLKKTKDSNKKIKIKKQLFSVLIKFKERFPEYFKKNKKYSQKLSKLETELKLIGEKDIAIMKKMNESSPEKIKKEIEKVVKIENAKPELLILYGKAELKAKKYNDAIYYFKKALLKAPSSFEALYFLGVALKEQGDISSAMKIFNKILKKNKNHLSSMLELADIYYQKDNFKKVEELCKKVDAKARSVQDIPSQFRAHKILAKVYLKKNNTELYKKELTKLMQIDPNNEEILLELVFFETQRGNYTTSLNYIEKFYNRNKGKIKFSKRFYKTYLELMLKTDDLENIENIVEEGLKNYKNDEELLLLKGIILERKKNLYSAKKVYEQILKLYPQNKEAYLRLADILVKDNYYEKALNLLKAGAEKVPNKFDLYKKMISIYIDIYDINNAISLLQKILTENPKDNKSRLLLAKLLKMKGLNTEALEHFQILFRNSYLPDEMIIEYAEALRDSEKYDKAIEIINILYSKNPKSVKALVVLASIYLNKNELKKAHKFLQKALSLDKTYPEIYFYRGLLFEKEKNLKSALNEIYKALQLDPENDNFRYHYARLLSYSKRIKDIKNSIKHLTYIIDRWIQKNRKAQDMDQKVFLLRGKLFFKMKLFRKALKDFETAIAIDPTNIETLLNYAKTLITNNKLNEAKLYIEEAISKNKKYYEAYYYLGNIYLLKNKRQRAQRYYEISLKGNTSLYPDVHKKLGYIYRDLGFIPLARREFKKYIKLNPKAEDVEDIKELLKQL